ncbi:hypothetical protein [Neoroseomonas rubea]|uniref:hypothetical protein n=1 Tax=Neoroseomonas rubea TaxID=2748666 RepID=UPI0018E03CCE|nr:hypothetical protein [Roseomonas rubea]
MRLIPALALSASLALGACTNPDGSTDWGSTLALGGGVAALTGVALLAANNSDDRRYRRDYRSQGGYYHQQRRHAGYYRDRGYQRSYW